MVAVTVMTIVQQAAVVVVMLLVAAFVGGAGYALGAARHEQRDGEDDPAPDERGDSFPWFDDQPRAETAR